MIDYKIKDILGREIRLNDIVAYASGSGHTYTKIHIGIVKRFTPKSAVLYEPGESEDILYNEYYMYDSDRIILLACQNDGRDPLGGIIRHLLDVEAKIDEEKTS